MKEEQKAHNELLQQLKEVKNSEELYRLLFEQNLAGVYRTTLDGEVIDCNESFARILGYDSKNEILKLKANQFYFEPSQRQSFIGTLMREKSLINFEAMLRRKDQIPVWVLESVGLIPDEHGSPSILHGTIIDITEQKKAQEMLRIQRDLSIALGSTSNFNQVMEILLEAAVQVENVDCGGIYLIEYPTGNVKMVAQKGLKPEFISVIEHFPGDSYPARLIKDGEPLYYNYQELKNNPDFMYEIEGLRALAIVPVRFEGEVVACLNLASHSYDEIPLRARDTIETIASQIGAVIARVKAEDAKTTSEKKYRTLFEVANDAILIMEGDRFIECNPQALVMFNCTYEQIIHKTPCDFSPPLQPNGKNSKALVQKSTKRALKGEKFFFEWQHCKSDGTLFEVEVSLNRIELFGKYYLLAIVHEITRRKRIEEELRRSEERVRTFVENIRDLVYFRNPDGGFFPLYPANVKKIGYSMGDFEADPQLWRKIVHPEDMKIIDQFFALNPSGAQEFEIEYRLRTKDRQWRWMQSRMFGVKDKTGKYIGYNCVDRDITERKSAEAAVLQTEAKYRLLFESSNDAIFLAYKGKFEIINQKCLEMFGLTIEQINRPDFSIFKYIAPQSQMLVKRMFVLLERKGLKAPKWFEIFVETPGSPAFEVDVSAVRIPYAEGYATQIILRDISEKKRLEKQLRQAQKMEAVGRLAGGIAHDFNNLLTAIIGHTEIAMMATHPKSSVYQNLEEVLKETDRAANLTRQLLAFSRRQALAPKIIDLNDIIQDMEKMVRRLIGEDIELVTYLDQDLWKIKIDPGHIEQVIMNLIVNARDAMPQGGSLIIETKNMELDEEYVRYHTGSKVGEYAMLSITDTGIGMSPAIKAHIFDPFYTTKEEGKGTGLGLATVYGIVKQTEGYIQVYSELEKGTCFRIYFPKSEGLAEKIVHKLEPERMPGGDETILIVEDDNSVRVLAAEVLKHLGYNVIEAKNGIEAMELGQKLSQPIDLLITDLIMPKINGVELSHQLKSLMPSLKVLYISGYSDTAIIHQGFLTPGLPYLQKPFRPTTLAHKVREIIIGK